MRFPLWSNPTNAPTSKTEARFIAPEGVMAWSATISNSRYPVPPGGGILRKLEVKFGVAPGTGKSWTVSYIVNGVEVESTRVKIEGAATTGEWKGELRLKEGETFQIQILGSGEPANPGNGTEGTAFYTSVETVGNVYWIAGGGTGNLPTGAVSYNPPFGINSAGWGAVEGATRIVIPLKCKLKGVAFDLSGTAGSAKSYTLNARVNRAEDILAAKIEGTEKTSALAEGSVQLNASETLEAKITPAGTPTARTARYTYAIEVEKAGEIFAAGMNEGADSATTTRYSYSDTWKSTWGAESTAPLKRPAGLKFEKLYIETSIAPGEGKSRTYALTLNGITKELKAKVEGTGTKASDTTHFFTTDGTSLSMLAEPSGTPAEDTGGVHWGFVVIVPQPAELEAAPKGSGSISADLRGVSSITSSPSGSGSTSATLGTVASLSALPSGQGAISGSLGTVAAMASAPNGTASISAQLGVVADLVTQSSGQGGITAGLQCLVSLASELSGVGLVIGDLRSITNIEALPSGNGAIYGELGAIASIEATPNGLGGVDAGLRAIADLMSQLSGHGLVNADLRRITSMEGEPSGSGWVIGDLRAIASMEGQFYGQGSVFGELGAIASVEAALGGFGDVFAGLRTVASLEAMLESQGWLEGELEITIHPHATGIVLTIRPKTTLALDARSKVSAELSERPKTTLTLRMRPKE